MNDNKHYTQDFDTVFKEELEHIGNDEEKGSGSKLLKGLAFSGGGIRSASFALGFMQALVNKNKLKDFDYLSTVSGGGYIGTSLTWFLGKKSEKEDYFSTTPDKFPFGQKPNALIDYIRQNQRRDSQKRAEGL